MTELADKIDALAESLEAATRHCYGLPVIATESDTQPGRSALWCDNGMAGCGQVAVSVGEFPDEQIHAIAALANVAMALRPHLPTLTRALRAEARMREALVQHNDRLRSAQQIASREGADTNWKSFRGAVTYTLAEYHELVNECRQALGDNT